jgi:hypothetical protein
VTDATRNGLGAVLVVVLLLLGVMLARADARPLPASEWTPAARLDLARSCAGEAGLRSGLTGECAAIAWVYARRFAQTRRSREDVTFHRVVRAYSAALKPPAQAWVLGLRADTEEPTHWPQRLSWKRHAPLWDAILQAVDQWATGHVENVCPGAEYYGGPMDVVPRHWRRVPCRARMLNLFWRIEG